MCRAITWDGHRRLKKINKLNDYLVKKGTLGAFFVVTCISLHLI